MFSNPLAFLFMVIFFLFVLFLFFLVKINLIALAFINIGIPPEAVFWALLATLLGRYVNIPLKKIPQQIVAPERRVSFFGFEYIVSVLRKRETLLAVNVGGAIIPIVISLYLVFESGLFFRASVATLFMTVVCYRLARPIRGAGIALPFFVPPVLAALVSLVVAYDFAPVVAYISGTSIFMTLSGIIPSQGHTRLAGNIFLKYSRLLCNLRWVAAKDFRLGAQRAGH